MSAVAHTPGPWEAADRGDYDDFDGNSRVILGDNTRIAVVHHYGWGIDEVNTRLIAAAPDMLAALKGVDGFTRNAAFDAVRAAIAKAEGRSND